MNQAVKTLAMFIRDLLQQPEGSVIVLGRTNTTRKDMTSLQIAVDQLSQATPLGDASEFDGGNETTTISQTMRGTFTIDFLGTQGYTQAMRYMALQRTQMAQDLQRALGVSIGIATRVTDLKLLTGQQYSERYQIEVNMIYNNVLTVPTNRIDTIVIDSVITDVTAGIENLIIN